MFAAQGTFCTEKHENNHKNLFSHARTSGFPLSKVWGNSSTQGVGLEGEAPQRYCLEQSLHWDTLQFAPGEWLVLYLAANTPVYLIQPQLGSFLGFTLHVLIYPSKFLSLKTLCFRGKCAFRHLQALKSAPVLKCGTFNYQRKENRGLLCQVQALLST